MWQQICERNIQTSGVLSWRTTGVDSDPAQKISELTSKSPSSIIQGCLELSEAVRIRLESSGVGVIQSRQKSSRDI